MSKKGRNARKTYILCLQKVKMRVYFTMLNEDMKSVLRGWFQLKKVSFLFLVLILLSISLAAPAESTGFRPGDWAFNYAPETSVLLLREDGTGIYQGTPCTWQDDGTFLRLAGEAGEISLRYRVTDGKTMIYLPSEYFRAEDDTGEGILGSWVRKEPSKSTFIFRGRDGMFLEDGTFTGTFRVDPEAGTILLVYIGGFEDTLLYYSQEGNDDLKIEYPWTLVETVKTP